MLWKAYLGLPGKSHKVEFSAVVLLIFLLREHLLIISSRGILVVGVVR